MSNLLKKRIESISEIIKEYGYITNGMRVISIWELAYNLNDRWASPLFCNKKIMRRKGVFSTMMGGRWYIKAYAIHELFRAIRWTVKHSDLYLDQDYVCFNQGDSQ